MMTSKEPLDHAEELRRRLESEPELKSRWGNLYTLLSAPLDPDEGEDDDVIALLVSEALDGVDIRSRYPAAFERLLRTPAQQELFLAALDSYEPYPATTADAKEPFPIQLDSVRGVISATGEQETWQARWELAARTLQSLFQPAELVFRDGSGDEEDRWITLLRDELDLGENRAVVVLDGRLNDDGQLEPQLKLAVESQNSGAEQAFETWGQLVWGAHQLEIPKTQDYLTQLSSVELDELVDPDSLEIRAPLNLTLNFHIPLQS